MNQKRQVLKYIVSDYLSASISWGLFFIFRKLYILPEDSPHNISLISDPNFLSGILLVPFFWLILYYASGYYNNVFRKSRLNELGQTLIITFLGGIVLFFFLILDDIVLSYQNYYIYFLVLVSIHFIITYIPRLVITTYTSRKISRGDIEFKSLLIGSNKRAVDTYLEIENQSKSTGNKIIGFLNVNTETGHPLNKYLPHLGSLDNLNQLIDQYEIEDIIVAIESSEHEKINEIIGLLDNHNVNIKVIPDMYDILTGSVKVNSIIGTPLIEISNNLIPEWERNVKHFMDITISILALILLAPLCLFLIIGIRVTSKGPIIYSHYRIGQYGRPFKIYKFRSMYKNAESNGPELSSKDDKRVTPLGKFMRKARLDEIPNFINVLKGDMSLVGYRPERKYFIDQIVERAPQYVYLHRVKPGITSLGQVKYGYAENVDQMIKRLRYDLIYMENMSIFMDFKILIYTITTLFRRNGV